MGKKKQLKVWQLVGLLLTVVLGSLLFVAAVGGWFSSSRVALDKEYYCSEECENELVDISAEEYEKLIETKKSFIVFIDQGGCTTAERLKEYVLDWALKAKVKVYRMMFAEMKETSLHDYIKYYPSVAVIAKGKVVSYLRADSDEDAEPYNNYEAFKSWIGRYLVL